MHNGFIARVLERENENFSLALNAKDIAEIGKLSFIYSTKIINIDNIEFVGDISREYYYINTYSDDNIFSVSDKKNKTIFIVNNYNKRKFKLSKLIIINKKEWLNEKKVIWGDKLNNTKDIKYIIITSSSKMNVIFPVWFCNKDKKVIDVVFFFND